LGLNWTPLLGQYIFAFYARGYQPGGYNGSSTFKPAFINDYELGWKSTDFNQHLQTSINGFYMNYQNMQEPLTDFVTGATDNVNLPSSTIKGIELQANGRAGAFSADLSASYTESELGRFTAIGAYALPPGTNQKPFQCGASGAPAAPNCTNYVPYYVDLSGENNAYTPKFQGSLGVNYAFILGNATLTPRVAYSYTSSQYSNIFENSSYYYMGPRHLLNAFLTYQRGEWQVQAYGTNLTNQIYLSGSTGANVFYGSPRQYGVSLRRGF
jgi:iron complex outermembrane receptor protein